MCHPSQTTHLTMSLLLSKQRKLRRVVLHWRLDNNQNCCHNDSHLHCATKLTSQYQAVVKFHGVFASHWKSLAFAPEESVRWIPSGDSDDLVTSFMQAVNQTARHFVQICYNFPKKADQSFLLISVHRCTVRTISSPCGVRHIVSEDFRQSRFPR